MSIELEKSLRKASEAYYEGAEPIMSDAEFDRLKDQLAELDPENSFLAVVGADVDTALSKVEHTIPMGSLNKATTQKELDTWRRSLPSGSKIAVQLKLDGISVELIYENGKFVQAVTRGNGFVGEDVTHSIKNAQLFPREISEKGDVSVRCECLLRIADWKKHFGDTANPRNTASGLARRTDGTGSEHLCCIAFDALVDGRRFATEQDRVSWLRAQKFIATSSELTDASDVELTIKDIESQRNALPYEIDGAVLKVNEAADQLKLGEHGGRPKWAIAWKFPAMGGFTTLEGITWTVGTRGTITPVANVAPVKVAGVTITNVTLHNFSCLSKLNPFIGDTVEVIRAGDVIPQIVRVVSQGKNRTPVTITGCPACKGAVEIDGKFLKCSNPERCGGVNSKRIKKWIKKREIMYLGDSNVDALIEAGVLNTIADIYRIPEETLAGILGKGNAKRIMKEINKSKTCPLNDLIGSLSLDMLGRSEAENLIGLGIDTLDKWKVVTYNQILAFPGFQETKAERISKGVQDNWSLIEEVAALLTIVNPNDQPKAKPATGKIAGKAFVFTGTMSQPRRVLEKMAIDNGGQTLKKVCAGLDYLVIADPNSTSNKTKDAAKYGVLTISEAEFMEML